jgi:hypothetical protein
MLISERGQFGRLEHLMWGLFKHLDRLLRGEVTSLEQLRQDRLDIPVLGLSAVVALLGVIYGSCMGLFAITGSGSGFWQQIPAAMVKVPALFFLTLIVTFPSLYVFNALVGSRLTFTSVLRLLVGSLAVMLAVLASLGPIVAFFSVSTTSYPFMLLLNVIVYALSGFLGLIFLLQTLHRITVVQTPSPAQTVVTDPNDPNFIPVVENSGALERLQGHVLGPHVKTIFRIWVIVFMLVGAEMAYVLRPFIGHPDKPFELLRERQGNFFQAVWDLLRSFFQ